MKKEIKKKVKMKKERDDMYVEKPKTRLAVSVVALVVVFGLLVACIPVSLAMQLPPHWFRGNVTINGEPAPDGTIVSAGISGVEYVNTTVSSGTYGTDGNFYVPSDDLDTLEKEGGEGGDTVEFYVNNELAANATFSNGGNTRLDLRIGKEPEIEKPAKIQGFLVPLAIAIMIVMLAIVIAVFIKRRKK